MSLEYRSLVSSLKAVLKARRVTYRQIADHMCVSEQTIKRLLTAEDGAVGRLAEICGYLGISFFEIARMASEEREHTFRLSDEQELYFCEYPSDYACFDELLRGRTFSEIRDEYGVEKKRAHDILRRLEERGLIERLSGDDVRLLFEGTHNWIDGGPLHKRFTAEENTKFIAFVSEKLGPNCPNDHFFTGSDRRLSEPTIKEFCRELSEVFLRFRKKAQTEEALLPADRLVAVKWLACFAPYVTSFGEYLKSE